MREQGNWCVFHVSKPPLFICTSTASWQKTWEDRVLSLAHGLIFAQESVLFVFPTTKNSKNVFFLTFIVAHDTQEKTILIT